MYEIRRQVSARYNNKIEGGMDRTFESPHFFTKRVGLGMEVIHRHPYIICILNTLLIKNPVIGQLNYQPRGWK